MEAAVSLSGLLGQDRFRQFDLALRLFPFAAAHFSHTVTISFTPSSAITPPAARSTHTL
jgi:hypothetical protein